MEYINLSNGIKLPLVGFGTFPLKGNDLKNAIKEASVNGYGLVDTAVGYGNNDTIGDLVASSDSILKDVLISTKIDAYSLRKLALEGPLKRFAGRKELSFLIKGKHVKKAIQLSFEKLHRIDIMLLHAPFRGCLKVWDSITELYCYDHSTYSSLECCDQLRGGVKAYGVSNFDIDELELLYKERGCYPMINQTEISPYNSQKRLIEYCKEHDIVVEAYSPFGRGKLTEEFMQHPVLLKISAKYNKTVGQIILRWLVQQKVVTIVRSTSPKHIKDNVNIFDFTLTESDMELIDSMNKNLVLGVNQIGKKSLKRL